MRGRIEDAKMNDHGKRDSSAAAYQRFSPLALRDAQPTLLSNLGKMRSVLALICICACLMLLLLLPVKDILRQTVDHQRDNPATYVVTYVVGGLVVPAPLLSVLAGVLLGPSILAVVVIMCGSLGSACLAFAISRFLLRQFVVRNFVMRSKQLQAIDAALRNKSVKLVICTRMVLPFTFNNYFLGTTSVTASAFALATAITGLPFAITYAIIGGELQSLDNALSAKSFELKGAEISLFGYCTISRRHLEITGICAGVCLFFFVIRTVKRFADRVIKEVELEPEPVVGSPSKDAGGSTTPRTGSDCSPRPLESLKIHKSYPHC